MLWHLGENQPEGRLTSRLHSLCLRHPTRHPSHPPLRPRSQCCHFPRPAGSIQIPRLGTCRFHKAATCHSRASWYSSHYRSTEGKKKPVRGGRADLRHCKKIPNRTINTETNTPRTTFSMERAICYFEWIYKFL